MPKREKPPRPVPNPRAFYVAGAIVAAILLLALFAGPIEDTDFWWHLKTGQYLLEHRRLPFPDPFSYTAPSTSAARFNLTHEWLSQALMYAVYSLGGFAASALARAALLAAVCGLAGCLAARQSKSFWLGVTAALAAASVLAAFTADRPSLVTFLGVAVYVALLETGQYLWALPVLSLLWANCHGGFFLGWIVLLPYCLRNRRLWPVAACAVAASLANPNGIGLLTALAQYRTSPLTASLIEWQRPKLWGPPYGFGLLLFAAAATLAARWRRVRPEHWLLFAAFAAASLAAFRNLPLIGFLAPVLIAAYAAPRLALPALALIAATAATYWRAPQPDVAQWLIPTGAADFLAAHHIDGRLFNTYEQGGYWIWRGQRVFIDGRALSDAAYGDYQQILFNQGSAADAVTGPRQQLLDGYGIDLVAMNALDSASGVLYPLALALANPDDTAWQLVYEDTQELVFMRHPPPGLPVLSNKFGRALRHLNPECAMYIEHAPDSPLCARALADYWMRNQAWPQARQMLRLYLDHRADSAAEADLRRIEALPPAR